MNFIKKNKIFYSIYFLINVLLMALSILLGSISNFDLGSSKKYNNYFLDDTPVLISGNDEVVREAKNAFSKNYYFLIINTDYGNIQALLINDYFEGIKLASDYYGRLTNNLIYGNLGDVLNSKLNVKLKVNESYSNLSISVISITYLTSLLYENGLGEEEVYSFINKGIGILPNEVDENELRKFLYSNIEYYEFKSNPKFCYKESEYLKFIGQNTQIVIYIFSIICNFFLLYVLDEDNKKDYSKLRMLGKSKISAYKDGFISNIRVNLLIAIFGTIVALFVGYIINLIYPYEFKIIQLSSWSFNYMLIYLSVFLIITFLNLVFKRDFNYESLVRENL